MANVIEELLISVGADIRGAIKGLQVVEQTAGSMAGGVENASRSAADALAAIGSDGTVTMQHFGAETRKTGAALEQAGAAGQKSFAGLSGILKTLGGQMTAIAAPLAAAFGAKQAVSNFVQTADALGNLSNKIGVSVEDLDAWGAANEAAGGSAQALRDSLTSFYKTTGRPAEEFFKLGEKIEGMTDRQKMAYLQAQGVALDAIPVFMQGQKEADRLVAKYRETAFTTKDAKTAAAFKTAWLDFSRAAQSVGNILSRIVLPVLTTGLDLIARVTTELGKNPPLLMAVGAGLLAAFGAKQLGGADKLLGKLGDVSRAMLSIGRHPIKSLRAGLAAAGTAMKGFAASSAAAAWPVLALAAAVAAAAVVIEDIVGFCQGKDSIFGRVLEGVLTPDEIKGIRDALNSVGEAVGKLWDFLKPIGAALSGFLLKAVAGALTFIITLIADIVAAGVKAWTWAKDFGAEIAAIPGNIGDAMKSAGEWLGKLADAVPDFAGIILDGVKAGFSELLSIAGDALGKVGELITSLIATPFKSAFNGIKSLMGFGDTTGASAGAQAPTRAQQYALDRMAGHSNTVNTQASVSVVNNIRTADNPQAIGNAIGGTMQPAALRMSGLIGQSVSGVCLKGG